MQQTKKRQTERRLAEEGDDELDRKPVAYFHNLIETKLQEEEYEVLAPGVTRVSVENETTIFRHISVFHALSRFDADSGLWVLEKHVDGFEQMLSVIMAAHHFNNRIPTIVPKLANLPECDIKVTFDIFDTQRTPLYAAQQLLLDILPRFDETTITKVILPHDNETSIPNELRKYPTGIVDASRSITSQLLAIIGGVSNLIQVSYDAGSELLDDKEQYPFFGRVNSPISDISKAAAEYFTEQLNASHVFVIYVRDSIGTSIFKSFKERASQLGLVTRSVSLSAEGDIEGDIESALNDLQQSGYRYVAAVLSETHYEIMLPKALERGLAGGGTFWMYSPTFNFPVAIERGDPLLEASHGSARLNFPTGSGWREYADFTEEWEKHISTNETKAFLDRLLPPNVTGNSAYNYTIPDSPSGDELYISDAFMSLALSSCDSAKSEGSTFSTSTFHDSFLKQDFEGVTGTVRFHRDTGSRLSDTTKFEVSNLLADEDPNQDGLIPFRKSNTHVYAINEDGTGNATWNSLPNTAFVYSDNSTISPINLPPLVQTFYEIETWSTVVGCVACAFITAFAVGFCVWMQFDIKSGPILAAQPFFMRMVAGGVVLMAVSLIPHGLLPLASHPGVLCMMGPWFLFIGFCTTFAAIFSKLGRINTIERSSSRMLRVTVTPRQVLRPFALLLSVNLVVLIAWTVVAPLRYDGVANGASDKFGRPLSFTMTCQSDNPLDAIAFRIVLGTLAVAVVMITGYQSYRARNTTVAYNESKHLLLGLVISSQSFFIGIPLLVAVADPSMQYLCTTLVVSWGCIGILGPILGPKIGQVRQWKAEMAKKEARKTLRNIRATAYFANVNLPSGDDAK
jgi:hypothetical protein